jgi:hypothetical protein
MFRKLAEAFENTNSHSEFINNQNSYFNSLPNMVLSGTSGLKGFDIAIKSVDSSGNSYQNPAVKNPNNIFIQDSSPKLNNLAKECSSNTIDELMAIKNPNASIGCGWIYSPPNKDSPYPNISQGVLGDQNGPLKSMDYPEYKKYFFDLQLAKKQILLDKCKALKACTDLDSEVFKGNCGYCTDTNQGVPIDSVGQLLYPGDHIGNCNPQSIITSSKNCPVSQGPINGPQPIIDKTCEPINGRLSSSCLYNQVISAGCNDKGTLAIALSNPSNSSDYLGDFSNSDAVKIYNRVANPPLNIDIFRQGNTSVNVALKEVKQIVVNTKQPDNTPLGAAARELCLQKGSLAKYEFCFDLPDLTLPPFNIDCLQKIFKKMGGLPSGTAYPNINNISSYNSFTNLGEIKQLFNTISQNMKSSDYKTQRDAMIQFLGISPDKLITRAPYTQGVEVIWLQAMPGKSNSIMGILKRTIENDIVQFGGSTSTIPIPQLNSTYPGFTEFGSMVQLFDVRSVNNFSNKFNITVDDSFFIAVNQPANIAEYALSVSEINDSGLMSNMSLQGPTTYQSNNCFNYNSNSPNITKIFYTDSGGGGHTFQINSLLCSGESQFIPKNFSLTLEPRAPFLNFEVINNSNSFDDIRNPGLFSSLITQNGLEFHNRSEEKISVPGKKGFIRFTNNSSYLNLTNIAYQAWGTCTFAFRIQSMPVKDAIFSFWVYNKFCVFYLVPINGSTAQIRYQTNMTSDNSTSDNATNFNISIGEWYFLEIAQNGQGFDVYCDKINSIAQNGYFSTQYTRIMNSGPITTTINNGLYVQNKYSCNISIGGKASGFDYFSGTFQFDIAWVHLFDFYINAQDVIRECKTNWIFTQFPDSANSYKIM